MKIEKTKLYQWDTNQNITGLTGLYVDFIAEESVYRVDVAEGKCVIPDEVLQVPGIHRFYECFEDHTMNEYSLRVIERLPPPDYAYTPTRQITFEELVGRVDALVLEIYRRADAGEFDGPPGKDYVITEKDYQDIASIVEKEINPVKSVNNITPDENGNVELTDIGKVNDVVIDGESVVTNKIARIPIGNERLGVVSAARHYLATTDLSGDLHAVTVQQAIFDSAFTPDEAFVSKGTLNNVFAVRLASYTPLTALRDYLTITDAKNTYATKSSLEAYITTAVADSRYATKNSLTSYLTISAASNTYATKTSLNNYLTTSAASSTYATKASLNNYLTTSAASSTYATKTLLNSYVTKTTADSTYATKDTTDGLSTRIDTLDSETLELYQSVEDLNDRIDKLEFVKIVDELPETGEPNIVYFVPKTETKESDLFDEYMWINSKWEFLGTKTIDIDLSEYAKKTEVETAIDTEALRFDKAQSLSSTQKAQAITNVGLDNVETLVENDGYVDLVAFTPEEAAKLVTDVDDVKADLSELAENKVGFTDYATNDESKAGVVKVATWNGLDIKSGSLVGVVVNKAIYDTRKNEYVISKGTLENRLAPTEAEVADHEIRIETLENTPIPEQTIADAVEDYLETHGGVYATKQEFDNAIQKATGLNLYDEVNNSVVQPNPQFTVGTVFFDGSFTGDICLSCKGSQRAYFDSFIAYDSANTPTSLNKTDVGYSSNGSRSGVKVTIPNGTVRFTFQYRTAYSGGALITEVMVTNGSNISAINAYDVYRAFYKFSKDDYVVKRDVKSITTVYISPNGDDLNDGLTPMTPLASFSKAITIGNHIKAVRGLYNEKIIFKDVDGVIIEPVDNSETFVNPTRDKIEVNISGSNDNSAFFENCNNLVLTDIRFSSSIGGVLYVKNSNGVVLNNCEAINSQVGEGFKFENTNAVFNNCFATNNAQDGFNFHGYGTTIMNDCVSINNRDDGVSHHDGCIGTINGGVFNGNTKAGIAPAYGAIVNIYNAICKENRIGIGYLSTTGHQNMEGIVNSCVMAQNEIGLSVNNRCAITAVNCKYNSNTTDKDIAGTLIEY